MSFKKNQPVRVKNEKTITPVDLCLIKKITRYNQMIVAIVDVLTSFDVVTNDNR